MLFSFLEVKKSFSQVKKSFFTSKKVHFTVEIRLSFFFIVTLVNLYCCYCSYNVKSSVLESSVIVNEYRREIVTLFPPEISILLVKSSIHYLVGDKKVRK